MSTERLLVDWIASQGLSVGDFELTSGEGDLTMDLVDRDFKALAMQFQLQLATSVLSIINQLPSYALKLIQ